MKKPLGVYIHIPFCIKKCNYCDFCSFPTSSRGDLTQRYSAALVEDISSFSERARGYEVDTLYFGGGTPTLLPIAELKSIMNAVKNNFELSEDVEITLECNPATCDGDYLAALREFGVNRISIGLQSASDKELEDLGRTHTFADFERTFTDARAAGFDNISVDVMYALPDSTPESFSYTLDKLMAFAPEHISAYALKIEEGTPFWSRREELSLPDDDTQFLIYSECSQKLGTMGWRRYEISNFAREGKESRHNLKYWKRDEYIGFGVAAYSFFGGERFGNSRDIEKYIRGEDICAERYTVSKKEATEEYIMLGLRLAEGIGEEEYRSLTGSSLLSDYPKISEFVQVGYMEKRDGRVFFTDSGFFVSNAILSELLSLEY